MVIRKKKRLRYTFYRMLYISETTFVWRKLKSFGQLHINCPTPPHNNESPTCVCMVCLQERGICITFYGLQRYRVGKIYICTRAAFNAYVSLFIFDVTALSKNRAIDSFLAVYVLQPCNLPGLCGDNIYIQVLVPIYANAMRLK